MEKVETGEANRPGEIRDLKNQKNLQFRKHRIRKIAEAKYTRNEKNYWPQQIQYYFYCIMLGNGPDFFPFMICFALKLSGGLFLMIFTMSTLFMGMPMIYMEIFLGRYTQKTNSQMYRMVPVFFGFGVMVLIMNLTYLPLKVVQASHFLIYFMKLMIEPNMFKMCPDDSDGTCFDKKRSGDAKPQGLLCDHSNYTCPRANETKYVTEYIHWKMFEGSDSAQYPIWQLLISLVVTWILICVILILGMRVMGALIKASTIAFWVLFTIVFIMALTVYGSGRGMELMVAIDTSKLNLYPCVVTIFYSISKLGILVPTGYMTASAYAKFPKRHGTGAETLLLVILNVAISIYLLAGTFTIAGAYAEAINSTVQQVMEPYSGLYLALIPGFLTHMDCPVSFMLVYLFSLWLLQVVSIGIVIHLIVLNLYDYLPQLSYFPNYVVMSVCALCFIMSIVGSLQIFVSLTKILAVNYIVLCVVIHSFLESFCVFYCYGVNRLCDDVHFMTGRRPMRFWLILWYMLPFVALVCFIVIVSKIGDLHDIESTIAHFDLPMTYVYGGAILPLITLFVSLVGSFLYVLLGFRSASANLLKPQFFWGPPKRDVRVARKSFAPRTSIRSQPPRRTKQRFGVKSIRQMHEKDSADGVKRGRIFVDTMYFKNMSLTKGKTATISLNSPIL